MWKTIKELGLEVLIKPVGRKWRLFIFWENSPIKQIIAQGHRANIVYVEADGPHKALIEAEERLNTWINEHKEECNDYLRKMQVLR